MPLRPSLTKSALTDIKNRRKDDPDVVALLYDIAKLRAVVLRASQLSEMIGNGGLGDSGKMILEVLRIQLEEQACVQERRAESDAFLGRPAEPKPRGVKSER